MPPIAVGPANPSWITPYYVPPGNQPPNAFASFMSGFMSTRAPLARAEFQRRLASLSPQDKSAEIAKLIEARANYVSEARKAAATITQSTPDRLGQLAKLEEGLAQANAPAAAAATKGAFDLMGEETLTGPQLQRLEGVTTTAQALMDKALAVDGKPADINGVLAAFNTVLMQAAAGTEGGPGGQGAVKGFSTIQMRQAAREIDQRLAVLERDLASNQALTPAEKAERQAALESMRNTVRVRIGEPGQSNYAPEITWAGGGGEARRMLLEAARANPGGEISTSVSGSVGGSARGPVNPGAQALGDIDAQLATDPTLKYLDAELERLSASHGKPLAPAWALENPTEYLRNPLLWKPSGGTTSERFISPTPADPVRPAQPVTPAPARQPTRFGQDVVMGQPSASQRVLQQLRRPAPAAPVVVPDETLPEDGYPKPGTTVPRRF